MADTSPTFGTRLARFRRRRGLNQAQLAKLVDVREKDIGRWETDENFPRGERIIHELADALGVTTDELFGRASGAAGGAPAPPLLPAGESLPSESDARRRGARGTRRATGSKRRPA